MNTNKTKICGRCCNSWLKEYISPIILLPPNHTIEEYKNNELDNITETRNLCDDCRSIAFYSIFSNTRVINRTQNKLEIIETILKSELGSNKLPVIEQEEFKKRLSIILSAYYL